VALIPDRPRCLLDRANAVLEAFDAEHVDLTLLGLVARTGLPKTTVHRTAKKMLELGWLECHHGRYAIGTRLFERVMLTGGCLALRDAALPVLQEVCAATRETANLAVLDEGEVLYLEKLVGRNPATTPSRVGGRMPALCTALGKTLTAFSPPEIGEQAIERGLVARTPKTVTSQSALRRELARVRREGIGFDHEETVTGVRCIAAPVLATDGSCVAAVSITAPADRLVFAQLAPVIRYAGQQASLAVAHRCAPAGGDGSRDA
jgi:DNA-binding IclR family transcriptional regulator